MNKKIYWGIKQWNNILKAEGRIDPATVEHARKEIMRLEEMENYPLGVGAVMYTNFYERRFMKRR